MRAKALLIAELNDELENITKLVKDFETHHKKLEQASPLFRHSYSFELDWEREKVLAGQLLEVAQRLGLQIQNFIGKLDSLQ
jgi:hypothetical protein